MTAAYGTRILVIEDDDAVAGLLDRALSLKGFQVTLALDGAAGRAAWTLGGFDLVLLDIMLPEVDGVTLCSERRAAGDTTPVILLTARSEATLRERALAAGANDYIVKPFAYADLIARIKQQIRRHQR